MSVEDFGDPDQIIHIPARDLTGTREAKLADLDMLLDQLQMVRLLLSGQPVRRDSSLGPPRRRALHGSRSWSWMAARLRDVRGLLAHGTAVTGRDRGGGGGC
jgi:hypothetical protein